MILAFVDVYKGEEKELTVFPPPWPSCKTSRTSPDPLRVRSWLDERGSESFAGLFCAVVRWDRCELEDPVDDSVTDVMKKICYLSFSSYSYCGFPAERFVNNYKWQNEKETYRTMLGRLCG